MGAGTSYSHSISRAQHSADLWTHTCTHRKLRSQQNVRYLSFQSQRTVFLWDNIACPHSQKRLFMWLVSCYLSHIFKQNEKKKSNVQELYIRIPLPPQTSYQHLYLKQLFMMPHALCKLPCQNNPMPNKSSHSLASLVSMSAFPVGISCFMVGQCIPTSLGTKPFDIRCTN